MQLCTGIARLLGLIGGGGEVWMGFYRFGLEGGGALEPPKKNDEIVLK